MVPSRNSEQFLVRMPPGMRSLIAGMAAVHRRSMNSEVIVLLEAAILMESKTTTGEGFADTAPAVAPNETALQGGPITHG